MKTPPAVPRFVEVPGLADYFTDQIRWIKDSIAAEPVRDRYQPYDGNLQALADLTGAADKLPYFTGPEAMTLTDFTAFARTIIDDEDAAAVRATLGIPGLIIVDSVTATYAANAALTTTMPVDDTIPLITEGTEVLSASLTPKTTTNKLRVRCSGFGSCAATTYAMVVAIYQGSTCVDASYLNPVVANGGVPFYLETEYTPGVTSSQTISVRVGPQTAGTVRLNGTTVGRIFGGAANATLVVEEIKA